MQKTISFVIVVVSLFLYFFESSGYSWKFCCICACLYVFNAVVCLYHNIRKLPVNFGLIFSLSLFAASFFFPLFVYPIDPTFSLFSFGYDINVINKCTALVTFAHAMYWFGCCNNKHKMYKKFIMREIRIDDKVILVFNKIVFVLFVAFLILGGLQYYTDRYIDSNMSVNMSFQYLNVLFQTQTIALASMLFYVDKSEVYFRSCLLLGVICITILSTGSRTLPMYLILVFVFIYQKREHMSLVKMVFVCAFILSIFVIIGRLRHDVITLNQITSYETSESELGFVDNFIDFIICNRNLYDVYSYVDREGILWGKNFLGSILSILPFAQSFVLKIFNIPLYQLNSSYFCTYLVFGPTSSIGLGTHVVGDVYLATGLVGVSFLFYLLGSLITRLENGMDDNRTVMTMAYLYMLSYSVFICRGSFFGVAKGILWMLFSIYMVNKYVLKRNSN